MTRPNQAGELLPCPFCGGEAALDRNPTANGGLISEMVVCQNEACLTSTRFYETEAEAIAAWNRRASAVPAGEAVAWRWADCGIEFVVRGDQPHPHYAEPLFAHPAQGEGCGLPPISLDGPNLPGEQRRWLARQLLDSRLSDEEAYGAVIWHPDLTDIWKAAPPSQVGTEAEGMREKVVDILAGHFAKIKDSVVVQKAADAILAALQSGTGK